MHAPIGLKGFALWTEKQTPKRRYDYHDCNRCAFAQYLRFLGMSGVHVTEFHWHAFGDEILARPLPAGLDKAVAAPPHTYGALTARLYAAAES